MPRLALLALLLAGCVGAFSKEPPCEPADARWDERLLGFWRADGLSGGDDRSLVVIGRAEEGKPTLRVAIVCLTKKDEVLGGEFKSVHATTIAKKDYAGIEGAPWSILRYEVVDADTVRVVGMDEKAVAADIKAGDVAGNVAEVNKEGGVAATIAVPTAEVRAYLQRRGDAVWRLEKPLVLRRLVLK